jgi:hypothetical protein
LAVYYSWITLIDTLGCVVPANLHRDCDALELVGATLLCLHSPFFIVQAIFPLLPTSTTSKDLG